MKKILFSLLFAGGLYMTSMAQTEFDGLRLINNDISGTARYSAMAGAFGALGGDPSSIKDNPAGLGIYRNSELSTTVNAMIQNTTSKWNDGYENDEKYNLNFNQFSIILANATRKAKNGSSKGLLMSNWAFNFHRLKDFTRNIYIESGMTGSSLTDYMAAYTRNINSDYLKYTSSYEPFDNEMIPWISVLGYEGGLMDEYVSTTTGETQYWASILGENEKVTPTYAASESGHLDEYAFNWSGNYSNRFFLGIGMNIRSYNYSLYSQYDEQFQNNGSLFLENSFNSKGSSVGLSIGAIAVPLDFLRLGLSLQTPMVFSMTDTHSATLEYDAYNAGSTTTPEGFNTYQFQAPVKASASAAFILGKVALVGIEYSFDNIQSSRFMDMDNQTFDYRRENEGFKNMFNNTNTIKIGAEFKINDNVALRAGYANISASSKLNAEKIFIDNTTRTDNEYFMHNSTNFMNAGIGYREKSWYLDFAVVNKIIDESFMPYNSNILSENLAVTPGSIITTNNNLVFTFGLKF